MAETRGESLLDCYSFTRSGSPFVEIIKAAREVQTDIIILGAHGQNFFRDVFIGTTAEKAVHHADRSILVVRKAPQGGYQRVVVAVDFSELSCKALEVALSMAPEAEFHVLHTFQYPSAKIVARELEQTDTIETYLLELRRRAKNDLDAFLSNVDLTDRKIRRIVEFGYPPSAIRLVAHRRRPDLVVVGATGVSDIHHSLLGSTAMHVLHELRSDVLVVRVGAPQYEIP